MAANGPVNTHYCHECESETLANTEDYTCLNCNSGFIEALCTENLNVADEPDPSLQLIQQTLSTFLGDNYIRELGLLLNGLNPDDGLLGTIRNRMLEGSANQRSMENRSNGSDRPPLSARIHMTSIDTPLGFLTSDGAIFDNVITILMNEIHTGPPPATESAINDLPKLTLTKETAEKMGVCSICYENFIESETVLTLPCLHTYHDSCVITWLKQHGTCPVCRKDLVNDNSRTDDSNYSFTNI